VFCFVTDESEESRQWETEFLSEESVKSSLESSAVSLRLVAGSQEAGFLEQLFPIPKKPTIVIIRNGELKDYIAAGTSKEDFVRRVGAAFTASQAQVPVTRSSTSGPQAGPSAPVAEQVQNQTAELSTQDDDDVDLYGEVPSSLSAPVQTASTSRPATADETASVSSGPATPSSQEQRAHDLQTLMAERARRLEADKKAKEAKDKAEKEARAKARKEVTESNQGQQSNIKATERKYAQELKKRQQEAKEERQRILKRIEDDKLERKQREAQAKEARKVQQGNDEEQTDTGETAPPDWSSNSAINRRGAYNLQVRLFDGSTIRSRFPSTSSIRTDVRKWVDESRTDGDAPYKFKVLLTPMPNRLIDDADEGNSLASLDLESSSTLILVPVEKYATAYSHSGNGGLVWRSLNYVFDSFSALIAAFTGLIGSVLGPGAGGGHNQQPPRQRLRPEGEDIELSDRQARSTSATANSAPGSGSSSRIRGFQNPSDRKPDQQLYNGNSLNFEPRNDDDDEER
jgi:hypothetical protein